MMKKNDNESGVVNARRGRYKGTTYTFTHRNPKTGEVFGEDIPADYRGTSLGRWVPGDKVEFID